MHRVQHPSALISNLYDIYALNENYILEESGWLMLKLILFHFCNFPLLNVVNLTRQKISISVNN